MLVEPGLAPAEPGQALSFARLTPADEGALAHVLTANDLPAVTEQFHPFALDARSAKAIATAPGRDRFYGARLHGRLVGLSMLRGWNEGYEVPSFGILVDGAHRGRGIGRALTEHTCEQARRLGCTRVRLSVYAANARAAGLYAALGFRERSRDATADGRERIAMELELAPSPIPVCSPSLAGNELAYVQDCLQSTWISSNGPYIERFEAMFAAFCDTGHAVACCNGTAALHLALLAAGVGDGDEVVVPALSYVACANAVVACGATPVLADADRTSWNLDPDAAAAALTPRTRAILAVHLYGHPADMDALRAIADRHGVRLVEDAAEAHGARYRGRIAGSLGDVAAFSFYGNKILTTGEGGMVVTDDRDLAAHARLLRGQGQDPERRYWHVVRGFNYRMTNVAAAIGVAQLERAEHHLGRRRDVARCYREALAGVDGIELAPQAVWAQSAHWMVCVRLAAPDADRDAVMRRLAERGIETRPFFFPLHELPAYADRGSAGSFPVAEDLGARGLCLPTYAALDEASIERVALALQRALV
jgi:perosamine synthetase